jgi:hypothetical protein
MGGALCRPAQVEGRDGVVDLLPEPGGVAVARREPVGIKDHDQAVAGARQHAGRSAFACGGHVLAPFVEVDQVEGHRERGDPGAEGPAAPQHPVGDVAEDAVGAA